jgi:hypothetical protein
MAGDAFLVSTPLVDGRLWAVAETCPEVEEPLTDDPESAREPRALSEGRSLGYLKMSSVFVASSTK